MTLPRRQVAPTPTPEERILVETAPGSGRYVPKCLTDYCERPSATRGLCKNHYISLSKMVREGRVVGGWRALEKAGKTVPVVKGWADIDDARRHWPGRFADWIRK